VTVSALAACNGTTVGLGAAAAGMYYTKPAQPGPADTASQIPAHENWCYQTMGLSECYTQPQPHMAAALINVDPQNRYPLTLSDYQQLLTGQKPVSQQ
jgi:hypothetical protein